MNAVTLPCIVCGLPQEVEKVASVLVAEPDFFRTLQNTTFFCIAETGDMYCLCSMECILELRRVNRSKDES